MYTTGYRIRRRVSCKVVAAVLVLGSCVAGPFGQTDNSTITWGQYRGLQSKTLGEERVLLIGLPADYQKSAKKYPVLYKLDGDTEGALQPQGNRGQPAQAPNFKAPNFFRISSR